MRRAVSIELAGTKQPGPSHHRIERRAQLVRNSRQKFFLQPARLFRLLARGTLAPQKIGALNLRPDRSRDVHRYATHSGWSMFVINYDRLRLDPNFASILVQPAKTTRAAFARRENRRRLGSRTIFVVRMNYREPEVWCRQPFLLAVTEHLLDVTADKVDALIGCVRFAPRFPNDARNVRHDVFNAAAMHFELRTAFPLFCF